MNPEWERVSKTPTFGTDLAYCCRVVGRITEEHLNEAEKTFPGIEAMYWALERKPATFLQLVWLYEAKAQAAAEGGWLAESVA